MAEYDKLKEMYRLQGQEEQGRRFRAMTGAPSPEEPAAAAAPEPMAGLEPIPAMRRSIEEDKAKRAAAEERYDSAERAFEKAKFGPDSSGGYGKISPDSFLGKYDVLPYEHEFAVLKTLADRGHVTLSPELKRDIARVQYAGARKDAALSERNKLVKSQEVEVARPTPEGKYVRDGTYDPYR